jgi:ribosome assembly protein YihI (activator of Der GTPase)
VFAAEARRYVDLQLDRAREAGASTDTGYRAAAAAEAQRYVDLQLDRARGAR